MTATKTPAATLRSERGTSPVSVMIVLMLVLLIFELVAVSGRLVAAQANVRVAAREAARRGTLVQNITDVEPAVDASATANLTTGGRPDCTFLDSTANIGSVGNHFGNFAPGGSVTATVVCTVDLSDLSTFGMPLPNIRIEAAHTEIIETYRAVGNP